MEITIVREEYRIPVTTFLIKGRINLTWSPIIEEKAQEEYDNGTRQLIIDLSFVDSITSRGLTAILSIYKMLLDDSKTGDPAIAHHHNEAEIKISKLVLVNPQTHVKDVLRISGFDKYIPIFEERQEAIEYF